MPGLRNVDVCNRQRMAVLLHNSSLHLLWNIGYATNCHGYGARGATGIGSQPKVFYNSSIIIKHDD